MWNTRECAKSSVSTACLEVLNRRTDNVMARRERTNNVYSLWYRTTTKVMIYFVVINSVLSSFITYQRFTRVTRSVPLVVQEQLILPGHLRPSPGTDNVMARRERTNNDLQKNIQKTKALERRNAEISGDGRRCPGSISCSCITSGTDRVTLVNRWYVMNEHCLSFLF
jgi:hypothetical protein